MAFAGARYLIIFLYLISSCTARPPGAVLPRLLYLIIIFLSDHIQLGHPVDGLRRRPVCGQRAPRP
jgi:hypothetical protein